MNVPRISPSVVIVLLAGLVLTIRIGPGLGPQPVAGQAAELEAVPWPASGGVIGRAVESDSMRSAQRAFSRQPAAPETSPAARPEPAAAARLPDEFDPVAALYPELVRIARLEEQDPDSAFHGLMPLLSSDDPVIRLAALESAADINHAARLPALLAALDDPSAQIRVAALEALMLHGDITAAGVIQSYVYDQDPSVRATAVDALAVLGNPTSIPVLAGLLYDGDRRVRINAVAALGEIGGSEAIGYLRPLRHDPDDSIRISANAILAEESELDAF